MNGRLPPLIFLLFISLLVACTPVNEASAVVVTSTAVPSTQDATVTAVRARWESGPHANTYDLGKGPNTYCARCHSPQNWDPAATIDPPPNCVSCKFPFEAEPRQAAGNPLVPAAEWQSIGCEICHPIENDSVLPEVAWLDVQTGYHETVFDSTLLCEQCHVDQGAIFHQRQLGNSVHTDFSCTNCHDAHDGSASCTAVGCHEGINMTSSPPEATLAEDTYTAVAHSNSHIDVTCVACHDGSGLAIGPVEGGNTWITFRDVAFLERMTTEPYQSHHLQRAVSCTRCHFPDNPWQLEPYDNTE
jgi:hypothetical protein